MAIEAASLLTVCGLDELESHGSRAVTHVLSILDPGWPDPDFGTYPPHVRTTLRFNDSIDPAPGIILPSVGDLEAILAFGRAVGADGGGAEAHLLVHCHAGISRSTAAITTILAQAEPATDERSIVDRVTAIRPQAWPNLRMIELADGLLGRDGRLVAAVSRLYRRRLAERPDLIEVMTGLDRAREVAIGLGRETPAP